MKRLFLLLIAVTFMFAGCATFSTLSPAQQQLEARMTFNNLVSGYVAKYKIADVATQEKWKADVEPLIRKAVTALDLWGFALNITDPDQAIQQEKLFLALKDEVLDLIIDSFVEK